VNDSISGMIDVVSFGVFHRVLDSINTISSSEPWVDNTFDHSNHLRVLIILRLVIERTDWSKEVTQSFVCQYEIAHCNSNFDISEEFYIIQNFF
jgi:hypothetical protein